MDTMQKKSLNVILNIYDIIYLKKKCVGETRSIRTR